MDELVDKYSMMSVSLLLFDLQKATEKSLFKHWKRLIQYSCLHLIKLQVSLI